MLDKYSIIQTHTSTVPLKVTSLATHGRGEKSCNVKSAVSFGVIVNWLEISMWLYYSPNLSRRRYPARLPTITSSWPATSYNKNVIFFIAVQVFPLLTSCSTVLLEKLTGSQLVKKFPAFYGIQRFITAYASARQLSLSRASSIQSTPPHPTSWRYILLLSSHLRLGLLSGLFPSGFPTKILYTPLLSPVRATCPVHPILLDFITRKISFSVSNMK
jgi:hypothetical protein